MNTALLPVVNRLQDVLRAAGEESLVPLPQLVMIGAQSSGKSSVLENIVGRDFLPRGSNIVTRRPLVLQLINNAADEQNVGHADAGSGRSNNARDTDADDDADADAKANRLLTDREYGQFLHRGDTVYHNFEHIKDEIQRETERLVGGGQQVSSHAIHLRIYSPRLLNLTLVDLPGFTKLAIGDQPADIETQIRTMAMSYISNPHAIIVAVTPANTDIANSDALKVARQVDPRGLRTIGVLTKLDLMDHGTDAMHILSTSSSTSASLSSSSCSVSPPSMHASLLRHPFVGIVNRSQHAINERHTITQAMAAERAFFANHAAYCSIAHRLGTGYLTQTLNTLLLRHIQVCLPVVVRRIDALLSTATAEMQTLHSVAHHHEQVRDRDVDIDGDVDAQSSKGAQLLSLLTAFAKLFSTSLDGRSTEPSMNALQGGASIRHVFQTWYTQQMNGIRAFDNVSDVDIMMAVRNASGTRSSLFVPEHAFETLLTRELRRFAPVALSVVDKVYEKLQSVAFDARTQLSVMSHYPALQTRVMTCMKTLIASHLSATRVMVQQLCDMEQSYINTAHPDFIGGQRAVLQHEMDRNAAAAAAAASTRVQAQHTRRQRHQSTTASTAEKNNNKNRSPRSTAVWGMLFGKEAKTGDNEDGGTMSPPSTPSRNDDDSDDNSGMTTSVSQLLGSPVRRASQQHSVMTLSSSSLFASAEPAVARNMYCNSNSSSNNLAHESVELHVSDTTFTAQERQDAELIKTLVTSYFDIVKRKMCDSIPKAIMHCLVNKSRRSVQHHLIAQLYTPSLVDELMQESPHMHRRRQECKQRLELLHEIITVLQTTQQLDASELLPIDHTGDERRARDCDVPHRTPQRSTSSFTRLQPPPLPPTPASSSPSCPSKQAIAAQRAFAARRATSTSTSSSSSSTASPSSPVSLLSPTVASASKTLSSTSKHNERKSGSNVSDRGDSTSKHRQRRLRHPTTPTSPVLVVEDECENTLPL